LTRAQIAMSAKLQTEQVQIEEYKLASSFISASWAAEFMHRQLSDGLFTSLACYNKCIKSCFNYRRFHSVTDMLGELGLLTFRTVFNECVNKFKQRWLTSVNGAVRHFIRSCTFSW